MRYGEAVARVSHALAVASADQAAAVATILREGAGLIPLPEGATYEAPEGLLPERREAWVACVDALRIEAVGVDGAPDDQAEMVLPHAGDWESVLATLLVQRDWPTITRTAAGLREWRQE